MFDSEGRASTSALSPGDVVPGCLAAWLRRVLEINMGINVCHRGSRWSWVGSGVYRSLATPVHGNNPISVRSSPEEIVEW